VVIIHHPNPVQLLARAGMLHAGQHLVVVRRLIIPGVGDVAQTRERSLPTLQYLTQQACQLPAHRSLLRFRGVDQVHRAQPPATPVQHADRPRRSKRLPLPIVTSSNDFPRLIRAPKVIPSRPTLSTGLCLPLLAAACPSSSNNLSTWAPCRCSARAADKAAAT